ncbi:MAG: glycosyltransferase [Gammaproteobacteria bacterium]|nr:glycosyltransferase [Gammaproteobacteria bacterium]
MDNGNSPLVSVIMPVYNGEKYLKEAIESILGQTYKNIEFIIINDGSKDRSIHIINEYIKRDERVTVIDRGNKGLLKSLDEGILRSKGEYIARMDADDVSYATRIEEQCSILYKNRDIDIVGCHFEKIDANGNKIGIEISPVEKDDILFKLTYSVPFAHASVMIRRSVFDKYLYSTVGEWCAAEDYALWVAAYIPHNYFNIDKVLFKYRCHASSFSYSKQIKLFSDANQLSNNFYNRFKREYFNIIDDGLKRNSPYAIKSLSQIFIMRHGDRMKAISLLAKNPFVIMDFLFFVIKYIAKYLYSLFCEIRYIMSSNKT